MSSTNRGSQRNKRDYYVTPIEDIEKFLTVAENDIDGFNLLNGKILDPCAGGDKDHKMSYPAALVNKGVNPNRIQTIDIRDDSRANIIANYLDYEVKDNYDLIITNPPFKKARKIVKKALKDVSKDGYVVMLLRLNFFGSQKRKPFWDKYMPHYCFVHHQRMSFTDDGKTDSVEYCHMAWQKGNYPDYTKLKVI